LISASIRILFFHFFNSSSRFIAAGFVSNISKYFIFHGFPVEVKPVFDVLWRFNRPSKFPVEPM
jgi:hypothetical protein